MDGAWRLRVYGAMVHGAGCVFESWMAAVDSPICRPVEKTHLCMRGVGSFTAAVERCRLCMCYVGVFSPKEKFSSRWCVQPMENPTQIMRPYIFAGLCVILFGSKSDAQWRLKVAAPFSILMVRLLNPLLRMRGWPLYGECVSHPLCGGSSFSLWFSQGNWFLIFYWKWFSILYISPLKKILTNF